MGTVAGWRAREAALSGLADALDALPGRGGKGRTVGYKLPPPPSPPFSQVLVTLRTGLGLVVLIQVNVKDGGKRDSEKIGKAE